jgi:hypothetical protein
MSGIKAQTPQRHGRRLSLQRRALSEAAARGALAFLLIALSCEPAGAFRHPNFVFLDGAFARNQDATCPIIRCPTDVEVCKRQPLVGSSACDILYYCGDPQNERSAVWLDRAAGFIWTDGQIWLERKRIPRQERTPSFFPVARIQPPTQPSGGIFPRRLVFFSFIGECFNEDPYVARYILADIRYGHGDLTIEPAFFTEGNFSIRNKFYFQPSSAAGFSELIRF